MCLNKMTLIRFGKPASASSSQLSLFGGVIMTVAYPFTAIVGQDDMKLALSIAAVDPSIGGVLVFGERGTGKSTTIRALAQLLPKIEAVKDCAYNCNPEAPKQGLCSHC